MTTWGDLVNNDREPVNRRPNIYGDAFNADLRGVWGELKKFASNAEDLSYYRALSAFMRGGRKGENQRRRLIYETLKAFSFASGDSEDTINKMYPVLPSSNLEVMRILNNLCSLYSKELRREIIGNNNDLLAELLIEAKFNSRMNYIHKAAKLCGEVAVRPRIRAGKLSYQTLLPDTYQTVKDNYGNLLEMWIPFVEIVPKPNGEQTEEQRFEVWDKDSYRVVNKKGEPVQFTHEIQSYNSSIGSFISQNVSIEGFEHGYGRLPWEVFTFDMNDNDGTESSEDGWEIIQRQIELNAIELVGRENYIYSGFSVWYVNNYDFTKHNFRIGPGRVLVKDQPNIDEPQPEIGTVSPTPQYSEFEDYKGNKARSLMKSLGLPTSLAENNPGLAASGEALKQDWRELYEARLIDMAELKQWDRDLIKLTATILNTDIASEWRGKFKGEYDITIDYGELQEFEEWADKSARLDKQKNDGTISVLSWYKAYTQDDSATTDEEAIKIIKDNLEMFNQLGGKNVIAGSDKQEPTIIDSGSTNGEFPEPNQQIDVVDNGITNKS